MLMLMLMLVEMLMEMLMVVMVPVRVMMDTFCGINPLHFPPHPHGQEASLETLTASIMFAAASSAAALHRGMHLQTSVCSCRSQQCQ